MLYWVRQGFTSPLYNWDMIGYVGSVTSWHEPAPDRMYTETLATLKAAIPPQAYLAFLNNRLSASSKALSQHLPFYQIKPLYTGLIWLVHQAGPSLPAASWMISAISVALLALVLFLWSPLYLPQEIWLLLVIAISFYGYSPMGRLAKYSTPDALGTLLTVASLYSWVSARSFPWFAILGWLAILARPDALIPIGGFAIFFAVLSTREQRIPLFKTIAFIAVLVITNLTANHFARDYGFERLFIYRFYDRSSYPAEMTEHLTLHQFMSVLLPAIYNFLMTNRMIALVILSVSACFCYFKSRDQQTTSLFGLLLMMWVCLTIRFVMFPSWVDDRFYYSYWVVILLASSDLIAAYVVKRIGVADAHHNRI